MEENVKDNRLKLNMQNPFYLAFFVTGVFVGLLLLTVVLKEFLTINVPSIFPPIISFIVVMGLGLIYRHKYNQKLPKDLIFKTTLYSSIYTTMLFLVLPISLFLYKPAFIEVILAFILLACFIEQFISTYFALLISNSISLDSVKLPQKAEIKLLENETIMVKAEKITKATFIVDLICFVLVCLFMYFIGIKLILNLNFAAKILITLGFIYIIADIIDRYFISSFILTNKRIVIRRIYKQDEILLSEVKNIESSRWWMDLGFITIFDKNNNKFKSCAVAHPTNLKDEISKFI